MRIAQGCREVAQTTTMAAIACVKNTILLPQL